jgi:hypothetical protein
MDHFKTILLRLQLKNKMVCGLGQLLVTFTSVIAHGHGDETFAQYLNELWPNNPNFTIGSLLRLFRTLEKEPIRESKVLFGFQPQNSFFEQIMQGSSCCLLPLQVPNKILDMKALPRNLLF